MVFLSSEVFPGGSDGKESACNGGDQGLIPGLGRPPGEGNGNPLQYSCLENPMDRGPRWLQSMRSQRIEHDWETNIHTVFHRQKLTNNCCTLIICYLSLSSVFSFVLLLCKLTVSKAIKPESIDWCYNINLSLSEG